MEVNLMMNNGISDELLNNGGEIILTVELELISLSSLKLC